MNNLAIATGLLERTESVRVSIMTDDMSQDEKVAATGEFFLLLTHAIKEHGCRVELEGEVAVVSNPLTRRIDGAQEKIREPGRQPVLC
jgi:hypothetical protein